jgi:hypothetical protein
VIGVHTPEFPFEHDFGNVRRAAADMRVDYPVAIDNDYAVWSAFANHYWPALYFADAQGRIRHHHFGEGEYRQSEMVIQQLLAEAGSAPAGHETTSVDARGVEAPADWASLRSSEDYTGYERTENFASPGGAVPGKRHAYQVPAELRLNHWPCPGTGRWSTRPSRWTRPAAGSRTASTPAIFTWSRARQHQAPACGSVCVSTDSRRVRLMGPMSTTRATEPWPNSGCISSSGSPDP